jgi:hypothetical protein
MIYQSNESHETSSKVQLCITSTYGASMLELVVIVHIGQINNGFADSVILDDVEISIDKLIQAR